MEAESFLVPGESVLYEARPKGFPPLRHALFFYRFLLLALTLLLAGAIGVPLLRVRSYPSHTWTVSLEGVWLHGIEYGGAANVRLGFLPGPLTPIPSPAGWLGVGPRSVPLAFVLGALLVAGEVTRVASWRARRYVVTKGYLFCFEGVFLKRCTFYPLRGGERVRPAPRGLVIEGAAGHPLELPGLDAVDAEGLSLALRDRPFPSPPAQA